MQATEWQDILASHGIMPPKTSSYQSSHPANATPPNPPYSSQQQARESEHEFEEDDAEERLIFEKYKSQRVQSALQKTHFCEIVEISQTDFVKEVTVASSRLPVILHLYQESSVECSLLDRQLVQLARRHPTVKFVKIVATRCIPNYPDKNVPTLIIYKNGDLLRQLVGSRQIGPLEELEEKLKAIKAFPAIEESD